jgi:hypothetical protein
MITRKEVAQKIEEYLLEKISKKDVYDWALKIVLTKEYDVLDKNDKLLSDAIHTLFCLHDEDANIKPSKEDLIYYRDRLGTA